MDRFEILKYLEFDVWHAEWPLELLKGAITRDNATDNLLLQLKMCNISDKEIKSAYFKIECFNDAGDLIDGNLKHVYQDINVEPYVDFGDGVAIELNDNTIRKINVILEQVVFYDDKVCKYERDEGIIIPKLVSIDTLDSKLLEELKKDYEEYNFEYEVKYLPSIMEQKAWNCCCGRINKLDISKCNKCNRNKNIQFKKLELEYLKNLYKRSLEQKKIQEEIEELGYQISKKKKKNFFFLFSILALIICIGAYVGKKYEYENSIEGKIENQNEYRKKICVNYDRIYILKDDGTVLLRDLENHKSSMIEGWKDIIAIEMGYNTLMGLKDDGTVIANKIFLEDEGTVTVKDLDENVVNEISKWSNIVEIKNDIFTFIALKKDGTVVATGENNKGQCDVNEWKDIIDIEAEDRLTLGLKKDGSIVKTGDIRHCKNMDNWTGLTKIICDNDIYGLKKDHTVSISGTNAYRAYEIDEWTDIVDVNGGYDFTIGIKQNGQLVSSNESIEDINIISARTVPDDKNIFAIALKKNGEIVRYGENDNSKAFYDWENIKYIDVGGIIDNFLVGIKGSNTVLVQGIDNSIKDEFEF